jgi:hypothetical protein
MSYYTDENAPILNAMVGKTIANIEGKVGDEQITFFMEDGKKYVMLHHGDCCEYVRVEDIAGELGDLIGSPLLMAEETTSREPLDGVARGEYADDSFTWTFYKFATVKGYVTIRWLGESNGYYSESVSLEEIT